MKPNLFNQVIESFHQSVDHFVDKRRGKNIRYSLKDIALSAFSVFFTQSPSFLSFQELMKRTQGQSNLETLFGVESIPTDNHIRSMLDETPSGVIYPVFDQLLETFHQTELSQEFKGVLGSYLVALDGTEYFHSQSIHCSQCLTKRHQESLHYYHSAVTPVLVHPKYNQVISLRPEFIRSEDGHEKQDCEINASKRWLSQFVEVYGKNLPQVTFLGDDLYAHQPFCENILSIGQHFICVCKEGSHPTLYEFVAYLEQTEDINRHQLRYFNGKEWEEHSYRYLNAIPLRDGEDALKVNWCEIVITNTKGKRLYMNTFITDYELNDSTIRDICQAGRARWKIENENNNTLKTKGYHLEHNFGHGKKHLASLLATLNMLAFAMHTLLELTDAQYQELRQRLPSREILFQHMGTLLSYICFKEWTQLLTFMIQGLERLHQLPLDTS